MYYICMADREDSAIYREDSDVLTEDAVKEPEMYRVILHNDHYTTMEFVVEILEIVFHLSMMEATRIMLDVHKRGKGFVGLFPYDIAATKVTQVSQLARQRDFPLKCTMEKA